ncbi:GDSL-type esterase/lipase family protein [Pedobacter sp. GR22-6]|uniref:GDSL-type esterase/lipase family protein n=1 Tax=Pedobacter sp. GR22-6 TaxID=3127957 RepID=UPI00307EF1C8
MYWYENDVKQLENNRQDNAYDLEVIFYGSSSIRLWNDLQLNFPGKKVANLGFGGSTLAACVWFFERIMTDYHPKALVVYAGDNDLGDGRNPEEIFIFFQQLMVKTEMRFGSIPCYFISLKPSLSRWHMADKFMYTNNLIEGEIIKKQNNWKFINVFKQMLDKSGQPNAEYYSQDGLHLSVQGYRLWKEIIGNAVF